MVIKAEYGARRDDPVHMTIQNSLTLQEYGSWPLLGSTGTLRLAAKTLIRGIRLFPVDREEVKK